MPERPSLMRMLRAAFYRGEDSKQIPENVVAVLWPGIAAGT
jgi:hypothetical protein